MVISLTFGILLGVPDAADSATRLVSLLPDAALDNENLLIAIGDLVGCLFCFLERKQLRAEFGNALPGKTADAHV